MGVLWSPLAEADQPADPRERPAAGQAAPPLVLLPVPAFWAGALLQVEVRA